MSSNNIEPSNCNEFSDTRNKSVFYDRNRKIPSLLLLTDKRKKEYFNLIVGIFFIRFTQRINLMQITWQITSKHENLKLRKEIQFESFEVNKQGIT